MFAPLLTALLTAGTVHSDCGPEVKIEAQAPKESTGTMHYADVLEVRIGTAKALSLQTNLEQSELAPLLGPCFRLTGQRYLLLGWSSYGAGMESLHAWVVGVDGGAVATADRLMLTTDRPGAGLLVRRTAAGLALGVPEPAEIVHDADDWRLAVGDGAARTLALHAIRGLDFVAITRVEGDAFYAPPLEQKAFPSRVAWVAITRDGFAPVALRGSGP